MPRFDHAKLTKKQRDELVKPLVEALSRLSHKNDIQDFISRLFTPSELIMFGRRFTIAEKLVQGKSYKTVRRETGVGFSTIRNVDNWLEHAVRDYHDIRAKQRQIEDEKKQEQNRAQNWRPPRRIHPAFALVDLLTQTYTTSKLQSQIDKKTKK